MSVEAFDVVLHLSVSLCMHNAPDSRMIRVVYDNLRVNVVDGDLLVGKSRSELLRLVDSGRRQAAHCCRHHDDMAIC